MRWSFPRLIAHRGGALLAPENTLPAFVEAARRGYRCIECDVGLSRDDQPMLLHDANLKRTTGHDALLADTPAAVVAQLDAGAWFDQRFAGTRVPSLAEAIACWREHEQSALIELKANEGQDPERLARVVAACIAEQGAGERSLLISFSVESLAAAAASAPTVPRALLIGGDWPADWREQAASAGACALDIDHRLLTAERVAAIHAAGLAVVVWTVDDPARVEHCFALGADGLTTDAIDRIHP